MIRKAIKARMKQLKISAPAVARAAGLNQATIYNYLAERSELTAANLEKVLQFLGIKVETSSAVS